MSTCVLSVVMPIYNGAPLVASALNSVIAQNISGMEILAIDDGSTDASWNIVLTYHDSRIQALRQENRGLAATLNRGIALAQARYIARQDQDDLVLPGRFARQLGFLEANPEVAMVGTWSQIYSGDTPTSRYHRHPSSNEALRLELLFDNPFVHSSMMFRKDVLLEVGGYSEDKARQPPEDYELWSRIARKHRVANLPEVLTAYREVPGSMSRTGDNPFLRNVIRISTENLLHFLAPTYSESDCAALTELYHCGGITGFKSTLSRRDARDMLSAAARSIAGPRPAWSADFLSSYQRMQSHLDSRFLRRRIPESFLAPARWLKNRLFNRGSRP
jgi:cellulose synthase/poly-beta-1,6-N-acetylglucosamine synthase-like glycosyltransferase